MNYKHGDSKTPLYRCWRAMLNRCELPTHAAYKDYGARGIAVCAEWHDYPTFKSWALRSGYALGLTLDRTDNERHYEPANCQWTSQRAQNRNKRSTRWIAAFGETKLATDWLTDTRCPLTSVSTLYKRLDRGVPAEAAISEPDPSKFKARCKHGHDMTPDNTYVNSNGARCCRACGRRRSNDYRSKERQ